VARMMRSPRHLACRIRSQVWVSNGSFGFLYGINGRAQSADPLALLILSLSELEQNMPFPASDLESLPCFLAHDG
jgi:hypothetical protein